MHPIDPLTLYTAPELTDHINFFLAATAHLRAQAAINAGKHSA
jgi:hypothetical protein